MSFKRGSALRAAIGSQRRNPQLGSLISNWNSKTAMATAILHYAITHAFHPSVARQGFDRVQLCRIAGGQEAESDSDQG